MSDEITSIKIYSDSYREDGFAIVSVHINGVDVTNMCTGFTVSATADKKLPHVTLELSPDVMTIESQADVIATRELYLRVPKAPDDADWDPTKVQPY